MNTIIMKNKIQKALLGFAGILALSSCSDFLDIKPQSEIILEDFWTEKADVDNIVNGCYSRMEADDIIRRMIAWGECRADNVSAGEGLEKDASMQDVVNENITTKNGYTAWDGFYNVINRCNTVLKYAPEVAASDPGYTQSELNATIAEVSALRDLCYFYLIRTFRNVPYVTEAVTDDDQPMELAPTSFEDILNSLIADLESVQNNAIGRYPITTRESQTGRITKCAIWAMLCEMYLWKGDYQNCIKYADMVINDKKALLTEYVGQGYASVQGSTLTRFNGFPLISNQSTGTYYGRAFTQIFITGNSQETIFELVYQNGTAGNSTLGNSAVGLLYGNSTVSMGYLAPSSAVLEDLTKEAQRAVYADRNKKYDARLFQNCNNNAKAISKFVVNNFLVDASLAADKPLNAAAYGRYGYAKINNVDHYYNSSNWIVYRLTDIMLMKAEALCQLLSDGTDQTAQDYNKPLIAEAFSLINAVNKRSVMQSTLSDTLRANDYKTKTQLDELVLKERQRELMFEGKRWYDLVRRSMRDGNTDVLCSFMSRREGINTQYVQNFFGSKTTGMNAIFWPYNYEETKVNPKLAAVQNPAFGSGEGSISK